jgi:hypothetical protein
MCVELEAHDRGGLSVLLMLGAANAIVWMCVLIFPQPVDAQRIDPQVESRIQAQVDVLADRQLDNRMNVAILTEKLAAMERSQTEITRKLDTIITGIVALFGTILSGCGVAYFSLRMGWVSARA